jgi:hypothetical protein
MNETAPSPAPAPAEQTQAAPNRPALPSAFSLFTPSVEALKVNLGTFIALLLSPIVLGFVLYFVVFAAALVVGDSNTSQAIFGVVMLLLALVFVVIGLIFGPAYVLTELKSAQKETVEFGTALKAGVRYMWKYLVLSLFTGLLILLGLLLFIVPGVFLIKRYLLAPYYLVDQNIGVLEAMKQSAAGSKRFSGAVWGLVGVQILVALSCIIPIVGLILSVMYMCAPAIRYYQIKQATGAHTA